MSEKCENISLLKKFSEILNDNETKDKKKLKIIAALYDIDLSLTEIHDSDIVKTIKKFKKQEQFASSVKKLLTKWKGLLDTQYKRSSTPNSEPQLPKLPPLPTLSVTKPKKADGIDSSSGLSFMDSLSFNGLSSQATDNLKSDVLNSLSEIDVDYAKVVQSYQAPLPTSIPHQDDDFDDGDLKFKSQRIIYAPTKALGSGDSNNHSRLAADGHVPSLVVLCTNVLRKNISQVDHVGHLPWFIFEKALKDAPVKDLIRIEKTNPQFARNMRGLFDKYAQRDFPHVNWEKLKRDFPKKPHGQLYQQLVVETENRLNSIINRTAHKVKEVRDAQRSVQTTSVILPKSVQRARQNVFLGSAKPRRTGERSGPQSQSLPFVTPRNMSYGETNSRSNSCTSNIASSSSKSSSSGGLMNQLKRKFVSNNQKSSKLSKF